MKFNSVSLSSRVSTDDQTLDLQRDALEQAKCRRIYQEHAGGKNTTRPELEACLKSLRTGDTLVVWRLDRLGRSLGNLSDDWYVHGRFAGDARPSFHESHYLI